MNSLDSQLASVETEDVSMANDDIRVWAINVGGITGLWKLSHWVETISYESRPKVLLIQDANMSQVHAKSINYFGTSLATSFFCMSPNDKKTTKHPSTVITVVDQRLATRSECSRQQKFGLAQGKR